MDAKLVERYKLARKHLNLTLEDIATELDCSHGVISGIELNRIEVPNFKYVEFLVNRGINFDYLLGKSDQMLVSEKPKVSASDVDLSQVLKELAREKSEKENLADSVRNMQGTINYLLGELERLKKELSQSRSQTYQMPSHDVDGQIQKVNFNWSVPNEQPNLGLEINENFGFWQLQATNRVTLKLA